MGAWVVNDEHGPGPDRNPLSKQWLTFRSWHGEATFWREICVRMLAALAAAGVVYLVAALAGLVSTTPLAVVGIAMMAITSPFLLYWGADMVKHRRDLRMSADWSLTPPRNAGELRIRQVYTRALPVLFICLVGAALTVTAAVTR